MTTPRTPSAAECALLADNAYNGPWTPTSPDPPTRDPGGLVSMVETITAERDALRDAVRAFRRAYHRDEMLLAAIPALDARVALNRARDELFALVPEEPSPGQAFLALAKRAAPLETDAMAVPSGDGPTESDGEP